MHSPEASLLKIALPGANRTEPNQIKAYYSFALFRPNIQVHGRARVLYTLPIYLSILYIKTHTMPRQRNKYTHTRASIAPLLFARLGLVGRKCARDAERETFFPRQIRQ